MLWTQIGDERTEGIPADGATPVDVYATFFWNNKIIDPERSNTGAYVINFAIGRGNFEVTENDPPPRTEEDLLSRMTPISGVELERSVDRPSYRAINGESGGLEILPAGWTRIKPISDSSIGSVTILAYTTYDKRGEISRLSFQSIDLPINSKEGGGNTFLKAAERYDIEKGAWEQIGDMNEARVGSMAWEHNGLVHVFGGFDGTRFLSSHEAYDPSAGTWSEKESIEADGNELPLAFGHSLEYGGKIFLVGGMNHSFTSASMLSYDPASGGWETYPKMPQGVAMGTATLVASRVYVMYGATRVVIGGDEDRISRFNLGIFSYDLSAGTSGDWAIENVSVSSPEVQTISEDFSPGDQNILTATNPTSRYGIAVIDDGGANEEAVCFFLNSGKGPFRLTKPLQKPHSAGESFTIISLSENRIGPNSFERSGRIRTFNGMSFAGTSSSSSLIFRGGMKEFDPSSGTVSDVSPAPVLPRGRAGLAIVAGNGYVVGGSGDKSEWLDETERLSVSAGTFDDLGDAGEMLRSRHSMGVAAGAGFVYACGGAGSGHPPGWLQIDLTAAPDRIRADGKETSSILATAQDDSGDPPPDGTSFRFRGFISLPMSDQQREQFQSQLSELTGEEEGGGRKPHPRISIVPVLFSSDQTGMAAGQAASILLDRSEDPIEEFDNLFDFILSGEVPQDQNAFRQVAEFQRSALQDVLVGQERDLYSASVEVSVEDDFYFGVTDTDGAIIVAASAGETGEDGGLTEAAKAAARIKSESNEGMGTSGFALVRQPVQQGLSAIVDFYSDIASIPTVTTLTSEPVDAASAKATLDDLRNEIPFGASPLYDALVAAGDQQAADESDPRCSIIAVSDNDESLSAATPGEVIEAANAARGENKCPVFVTNFVISDPVTLAARRARTDVADLEQISSGTGGNSFSVVDESYIDFVIKRIKTAAPSALSSALIVGDYQLEGVLREVSFRMTGMTEGSSAKMTLSFSNDGYAFEDSDVEVELGAGEELARHVFDDPIDEQYVRFSLLMSTSTFQSPRLQYVSFDFVRPNVQYLFTYPQQVSGQIAELAGIVNHRLPEGSRVEMGFVHGTSFVFDRDYASVVQPPIVERGVTMAINRSFDTFVGDALTFDTLETEDFKVYRSVSGSWQGSSLKVLVNGVEVLPTEYDIYPEKGLVVFHTKKLPGDVVQITDVVQPSNFRVGVKITNPTLQGGYFDSFAYSWTGTQDDTGGRSNRTPRAVNLFISPRFATAGGPLTAEYTFIDPDGDKEDASQTEITWYRNGVPIPELSGKTMISNSDFIANRPNDKEGIRRGQEWFFTVRPSDGRSFGPLAVSEKLVVANQPPSVSKATLISSNEDPLRFTSIDSISVEVSISDTDGDETGNNLYAWFANGVVVKRGTDSIILPNERDANGNFIIAAGNGIRCRIMPYDGTDYGDEFETETVTIEAAPPAVSNVQILPDEPTLLSNLVIQYDYSDPEDLADQSNIQWFRNGSRVSELDSVRVVTRSLLSPGQEWYALVVPSNGSAEGIEVQSNTVRVTF